MRHALDIWQEISRHLGLSETLERLAPLVREEHPFDVLSLRRLDPARARLKTLASVHPDGRSAAHLLSSVPQAALSRLQSSLRSAFLLVEGHPDFVSLSPFPGMRSLLVLPLAEEVVLVLARREAGWEGEELEKARWLAAPLRAALENHLRLEELAELRESTPRPPARPLPEESAEEKIIGASAGLREVIAQVSSVAPTDAPVLLLGETGSGKEVIARALHERSSRAKGPIVRVNCGAIAPELVDSVLFGHEKGAFTGAVATHQGWFERADGGTLFLDEVAELPPAAQVRLLRVLQEGTFERVGAQRTLRVDVRIVAATHRDMPRLVEQGLFRADLWYRLGVFPLRLPALRERMEDLPALVRHFARSSAQRLGVGDIEVSAEDLGLLSRHSWPGNVRELAAVIERAAILGGGRRLDLAAALGAPRPALVAPPTPPSTLPSPELEDLDDAMVRHIEQALERTRGRIEGPLGAAALLRINPHTLRSRMRKLGLDWKRFRLPDPELLSTG